MASILYLPDLTAGSRLKERFRSLLEITVPDKQVEIYSKFEQLSQGLRETGSTVRVAVLFIVNQTELSRILSLGDLLTDVKIVLILADDDADTMAKVHRLRPRYVTWTDCDIDDLATVFKRMIGLYDIR